MDPDYLIPRFYYDLSLGDMVRCVNAVDSGSMVYLTKGKSYRVTGLRDGFLTITDDSGAETIGLRADRFQHLGPVPSAALPDGSPLMATNDVKVGDVVQAVFADDIAEIDKGECYRVSEIGDRCIMVVTHRGVSRGLWAWRFKLIRGNTDASQPSGTPKPSPKVNAMKGGEAKIGDLIRCLETVPLTDPHFHVGGVYKVTAGRYPLDSEFCSFVGDDGERVEGVYWSRFEKVEEAPLEPIAVSGDPLELAAKLTLLWFSGAWDDAKRAEWLAITGSDDATSKCLCDFIRRALATKKEKEAA